MLIEVKLSGNVLLFFLTQSPGSSQSRAGWVRASPLDYPHLLHDYISQSC